MNADVVLPASALLQLIDASVRLCELAGLMADAILRVSPDDAGAKLMRETAAKESAGLRAVADYLRSLAAAAIASPVLPPVH